jgi:uncharacterized membrane protein YcfT
MSGRMVWMDSLRGAAIVAVVVMHAELQVASATGVTLPTVHAVDTLLGPVRMPLLVLLSGMLLPVSLAKGPWAHVRGKLAGIGWPYLVWGLLDVVQVQHTRYLDGLPPDWTYLGQLAYDPHTYLWFLAYLLVYHLAVTFVPPAGRTTVAPAALAIGLALPVENPAQKFVLLFGWFLVGDLLGRLARDRVPLDRVRVEVPVLSAIGRQSLVFYVCHLLVIIYAARVLVSWGLTEPHPLFVALVAVPLATGALLVAGREWRVVDALFRWPGLPRRSQPRGPRPPAELELSLRS